jgi:hypothetical protein
MRRQLTLLAIVLGGAIACLLFSPETFAGPGDSTTDEPPRGLMFQTNAKGTKLNGFFAIELTDVDAQAEEAVEARAVVRLRKGKDIVPLEIFYASVSDIHDCPPSPEPPERTCVRYGFDQDKADIQAALLTELAPIILDRFFPGESKTLTTKRIDQFADNTPGVVVSPSGCGELGDQPCTSLFSVADLELAAK